MPKLRDPDTGRFVSHESYERRPFSASGREYELIFSRRELDELRASERQLALPLGGGDGGGDGGGGGGGADLDDLDEEDVDYGSLDADDEDVYN